MVSVTVVIPTKNAGERFETTLERIRQQTVESVEVVVVDSGSSDGTVALAEALADEVIEIDPDEFHHGRTRNRGARAATGDVVVFTVQDAIPAGDEWLERLVGPIADGDADLTYGNQIAHHGAKPPDRFFYQYFYPDEPVTLDRSDTADKAAFYLDNVFLSDVNCAVAADVWEEFRFRDSVSMSEDKDFAYRVAAAGNTIRYCPDAAVYHSHDYDLRSLFARRYRDGKAMCELDARDSDSFVYDGIRYVAQEHARLVREGKFRWIPYTLMYEMTYFLSLTAGQHHRHLPRPIDHILSR